MLVAIRVKRRLQAAEVKPKVCMQEFETGSTICYATKCAVKNI
jgi:hypothetical protein